MPVIQEIHEGCVPLKVYTGDIEPAARKQLVNISRLPVCTTTYPGIEKRIGKNSRWELQLGTLGGGNHFIEVCLDEASRLAYFPEGARHFDDYVQAVGWAQDYARANRAEMIRRAGVA